MVAITALLVAAAGKSGGALAGLAPHRWWGDAYTACSWLMTLAAVLTVTSGIRYVVDAWPLFRADGGAEDAVPKVAAGGR
jgi:phosphatidylglycerophosphate synthase